MVWEGLGIRQPDAGSAGMSDMQRTTGLPKKVAPDVLLHLKSVIQSRFVKSNQWIYRLGWTTMWLFGATPAFESAKLFIDGRSDFRHMMSINVHWILCRSTPGVKAFKSHQTMTQYIVRGLWWRFSRKTVVLNLNTTTGWLVAMAVLSQSIHLDDTTFVLIGTEIIASLDLIPKVLQHSDHHKLYRSGPQPCCWSTAALFSSAFSSSPTHSNVVRKSSLIS